MIEGLTFSLMIFAHIVPDMSPVSPLHHPLLAPLSVLKSLPSSSLPRVQRWLSTKLGQRAHQSARICDLLMLKPTGQQTRTVITSLSEAKDGERVIIEGVVRQHQGSKAKWGRAPRHVSLDVASGETLTLAFFNMPTARLHKTLPVGRHVAVSGKIERFQDRWQMVHPEWVVDPRTAAARPKEENRYPVTEGISPGQILRAIREGTTRLMSLPEWAPSHTLKILKAPNTAEALKALHDPNSEQSEAAIIKRLAYDEMLALQIALRLLRQAQNKPRQTQKAKSAELGDIAKKIEEKLPFKLTNDQKKALEDIRSDKRSSKRMLRLLQGDVGSGKTILAVLAAAETIAEGGQVAVMAPTDVLTQQHAETFTKGLLGENTQIITLTGRDTEKQKEAKRELIASGKANLIIGTHALFQDSVVFQSLKLAIIDEQHRFGVQQRLALTDKGNEADLLFMTATPIPRSLLLTFFGDLDVSVIREKPPTRQPVTTKIIAQTRISDVIEGLKKETATGAQAFWVCPLVEESEAMSLMDAQSRYDELRKTWGDRVGLIHGRLSASEKDNVLQAFSAGKLDVLVATTVIEVGVNIPNATIMVIEHAERFGLAQLHQLRGRVGRGSQAATCLLIYRPPLNLTAKERLAMMRETDDGFKLAEADLKTRGGGDVAGYQQSGFLNFRFADLHEHAPLAALAREDAEDLIRRDPRLESEQGQAVQLLLKLYGRDEALSLLPAG